VKGPRLFVVLSLVCGLAACSGRGSGSSRPKPSELLGQAQVESYQGAGLRPPLPRPSFTLTDTAGKRFAFGSRTKGHPTFLYFGYTRCPDVCPETMADIGNALTNVSPSIAANSYVVFVSTDVKHDTGPVINEWLSHLPGHRFGRWVGLRGTRAQVDAAQAAAHITLATDDGLAHSAQALLYGPDDYAHVTFLQSNNEQQAMIHDLPIVAAGH
jgi:protein SCO1/2